MLNKVFWIVLTSRFMISDVLSKCWGTVNLLLNFNQLF
jgi:hypothetical protein